VTVSAAWTTSRLRPVGEELDVPNAATPEIETAGPRVSFTGASSRLRVYCARASLMTDAENVDRRLTAPV
jgi:hypothetical protein